MSSSVHKHTTKQHWKPKAVSSNNQHHKQKKEPEEHKIEQWKLDNLEQQTDELQSLTDIYSDDEIIVLKKPSSYKFQVSNDDNEKERIVLGIQCPIEYPSKSPPTYSISSTYLKRIPNRLYLEQQFASIWQENKGQPVMFEWISEFQQFASSIFHSNDFDYDVEENILLSLQMNDNDNTNNNKHCTIPIEEQRNKLRQCPDIYFCSQCIEDRKSVFKSYMAFVQNMEQIEAFIDKLHSNKKIARATHNMIAYRLSTKSAGILNEHYDDDGEAGGGKVILEILKLRNMVDVVVMVSRWYGGIHLSSDRFKHIKSMTQYVLEEYAQHHGNKNKEEEKGERKPLKKNQEMAMQIVNRLYWTQSDKDTRFDIYVGCKCKDKKLHQIVEFNLEEFGVQKQGIDWIEYISYRGKLVWDVWKLCNSYEAVIGLIHST